MADAKSALAEATTLLKRAVELDNNRKFTDSLLYYEDGIGRLVGLLKVTKEEEAREKYRQRITQYLDRAEKLKKIIEEETKLGKINEQIHIEENSMGHSYERIFGRLLHETVTHIEVDDPYIRSIHQIYNFLRFCEVVVKSKAPVKTIHLTTGKENESQQDQQQKRLSEIACSLQSHGISLTVDYSDTLHDREIRFNNGLIIKIGRGLDYFKALQSKFSIGYCDYDLRPCSETTIDIFHKNSVNKS